MENSAPQMNIIHTLAQDRSEEEKEGWENDEDEAVFELPGG